MPRVSRHSLLAIRLPPPEPPHFTFFFPDTADLPLSWKMERVCLKCSAAMGGLQLWRQAERAKLSSQLHSLYSSCLPGDVSKVEALLVKYFDGGLDIGHMWSLIASKYGTAAVERARRHAHTYPPVTDATSSPPPYSSHPSGAASQPAKQAPSSPSYHHASTLPTSSGGRAPAAGNFRAGAQPSAPSASNAAPGLYPKLDVQPSAPPMLDCLGPSAQPVPRASSPLQSTAASKGVAAASAAGVLVDGLTLVAGDATLGAVAVLELVPIVGGVFTAIRKIAEMALQAAYNQSNCILVSQRCTSLEGPLEQCMTHFRSKGTCQHSQLNALRAIQKTLEELQALVMGYTNKHWIRQGLGSGVFKAKYDICDGALERVDSLFPPSRPLPPADHSTTNSPPTITTATTTTQAMADLQLGLSTEVLEQNRQLLEQGRVVIQVDAKLDELLLAQEAHGAQLLKHGQLQNHGRPFLSLHHPSRVTLPPPHPTPSLQKASLTPWWSGRKRWTRGKLRAGNKKPHAAPQPFL